MKQFAIRATICVTVFAAQISRADDRVAMVIAGAEPGAASTTTQESAHLVAEALRDLDFETDLLVRAEASTVLASLDRFSEAVANARIAMVVYMGPATRTEEYTLLMAPPGVALQEIYDRLTDARQVGIVLLDPHWSPDSLNRPIATPPNGILLSVSAPPGMRVGTADHIAYAEAIAAQLSVPARPLSETAEALDDAVAQATGGRLRPYTLGRFYGAATILAPDQPPAAEAAETTIAAATATTPEPPLPVEVDPTPTIVEETPGPASPPPAAPLPDRETADSTEPDLSSLGATFSFSALAQPVAEPLPPGSAASDPGHDLETRYAIQQALQRQGFYAGAIDAIFGRGTRAAVRAYQESLGSQPTGFLGPSQVDMLLGR